MKRCKDPKSTESYDFNPSHWRGQRYICAVPTLINNSLINTKLIQNQSLVIILIKSSGAAQCDDFLKKITGLFLIVAT